MYVLNTFSIELKGSPSTASVVLCCVVLYCVVDAAVPHHDHTVTTESTPTGETRGWNQISPALATNRRPVVKGRFEYTPPCCSASPVFCIH